MSSFTEIGFPSYSANRQIKIRNKISGAASMSSTTKTKIKIKVKCQLSLAMCIHSVHHGMKSVRVCGIHLGVGSFSSSSS